MGLKAIITNYSICFNCSAGMNSGWHPEISKESWPKGPGFGYPQRGFALLKIH